MIHDPQVLLDIQFLLALSDLFQSYLKPFSRGEQGEESDKGLLEEQNEDSENEAVAGASDGEVMFLVKVSNPRIALLEDTDVADCGALVLQVGVAY